ncbi:MAG TPA: CoA-binding protein [Actinobacteria bacterium]|nr:CoA-binding protein [Actinomycetota bacterium]HCK79102.1 CoA-binding protein [Actinomycetota bacterium]
MSSPPANADSSDEALITTLVRNSRKITVVGASRDPGKAAHQVPAALLAMGYGITPVNPSGGELLGQVVAPSLAQVSGPIDLVDVFRPSADAADITRQAIAVGARAVWLQLGIVCDEAAALCAAAGVPFVQNRCLLVEARRLMPSGRIPSL